MRKYHILISAFLAFALMLGACAGTSSGSKAMPAASSSEAAGSVSTAEASSDTSAKDPEGLSQTAAPSSAENSGRKGSVSPSPSQTPAVSGVPGDKGKNQVSLTPSGTPTPTPEPENSLAGLEKQLKALLKDYDGTWSVYCKRLDTDESICINDKSLIAASLIKLYVFGAVMEAVEEGYLYFEDYSEPLELMIEYSDNDSCNILIDAVGGFEAVNDFIDRQGFKKTELYRYMLADRSIENYTCTKECGELLEQVIKGTYVSKEASDLLLYHLKNQYYLHKIPAGVPEGVKTANKTGELENAEHDAAVIWSPACTYILTVMSNDLEPYDNDGIAQVCEISETVYNYLND